MNLFPAVIGLEFAGAIIFATFIAFTTSVVTSIDVNSRKIAEELDAVASFVQVWPHLFQLTTCAYLRGKTMQDCVIRELDYYNHHFN